MAPTVSRINITPIKGTALQQPQSVRLGATGVHANRRFYLIDDDGVMVNGKRAGNLVQLQAVYDEAAGQLSVAFPDGARLAGQVRPGTQAVVTNFYGRPVHGVLVNTRWNQAVSEHAGKSLRLVQVDADTVGTDVHPVTLISQATLEALRSHADGPMERWADRFRMMFELAGTAAFEEDGWLDRRIAIGTAIVRLIGPVPRCLVTGQDPATGARNFETLQALRDLRSQSGPGAATAHYPVTRGGRLMLGMYARVEQDGEAWLGCPVDLLK